MYNVVIADDHPATRMGLKLLLEEKAKFRITAETSKGKDLSITLKKTNFDLLILDIMLADMSAIEFLQEYSSLLKDKKVVIYTMYSKPNFIARLTSFPIHGILLKSESISKLPEILLTIMQGDTYFSPALKTVLKDKKINRLTKKEKEILKYLLEGFDYKKIATLNNISYRTVEYHTKQIREKFDARNLPDLLNKARDGISQI